jgi:hypothetical protein
MDWVSDRSERERIIAEGAPNLWSDVCSAFEEAVKSMQRKYPELPNKPEYSRISENKFVVRLRRMARDSKEVSVTFSPDRKEILVDMGIAKRKYVVTFDVDDGAAVLKLDGRAITPDELSRHVLEPLFFEDR